VPYLVVSIEHAFAIGEMVGGAKQEEQGGAVDLLAVCPPFPWLRGSGRKQMAARKEAIKAAGGRPKLRRALEDLRLHVGWSVNRLRTVYSQAKTADTTPDDDYRIDRVARRRYQRRAVALAALAGGERAAGAVKHVAAWALEPGASWMINRVRGRLRGLGLDQATIARLEFAWLFPVRQRLVSAQDGFKVMPASPWPPVGRSAKDEFERLRNQIKQVKSVLPPEAGTDNEGLPRDMFSSLAEVVRASRRE
jgi:hypothetical protein